MKLFKLCAKGGFTHRISLYGGKSSSKLTGRPFTQEVVMNLVSPFLHCGRELYTDNFYTSVELAHELLKHKTHLTGTLRKTRRHLPKSVVNAKLKKDEVIALQSSIDVIVAKWKDKRDVLFFSTCHIPEMVDKMNKYGKVTKKPLTILEYNQSKAFIDLSDQLSSYITPLRRSVKWYRKVAFEILFNTCVINAKLKDDDNETISPKSTLSKFDAVFNSVLNKQNEAEDGIDEPGSIPAESTTSDPPQDSRAEPATSLN
ncbi:piggyBac transposable element-derived protein 4-like [Nilaparvata lugens]|uniref:piggyBac transposable element-derived protein 4-like n=1 Tax=Nilaparvata lugens TaxID=108931 RepID=UPI00193D86F5|nr:piggyBac transposable element-derived protein 4-like [Nilaparvata lugens]